MSHAAKARCRWPSLQDEVKKQVFRLADLLFGLPDPAGQWRSWKRGIVRLTAAGPLPTSTGFPIKPCQALFLENVKKKSACQVNVNQLAGLTHLITHRETLI
jgi:hypothetical protein